MYPIQLCGLLVQVGVGAWIYYGWENWHNLHTRMLPACHREDITVGTGDLDPWCDVVLRLDVRFWVEWTTKTTNTFIIHTCAHKGISWCQRGRRVHGINRCELRRLDFVWTKKSCTEFFVVLLLFFPTSSSSSSSSHSYYYYYYYLHEPCHRIRCTQTIKSGMRAQ